MLLKYRLMQNISEQDIPCDTPCDTPCDIPCDTPCDTPCDILVISLNKLYFSFLNENTFLIVETKSKMKVALVKLFLELLLRGRDQVQSTVP